MIEQPRRQTGPREAQWFYSICACGKLVEVTGGIMPEHEYTTDAGSFSMYGAVFKSAVTRSRCHRSGQPHSAKEN